MSPPLGRNRRQRRRRAAVVGGVAYEAGKRRADSQQEAGAPEPAPEQAAPASTGGMSPEAMAQLKELAELHQSGALTDEEFEQQKAKLLGG
jgi:Short C-terminal domain